MGKKEAMSGSLSEGTVLPFPDGDGGFDLCCFDMRPSFASFPKKEHFAPLKTPILLPGAAVTSPDALPSGHKSTSKTLPWPDFTFSAFKRRVRLRLTASGRP